MEDETQTANGSKMPGNATVFVVDEATDVREILQRLVSTAGLSVELFSNAQSFLDAVAVDQPGCIVVDQWLPDMSGLELMKELSSRGIGLPVIMMSGYSDVSFALEAIKSGGFDYIEKPFSLHKMLETIQRAVTANERVRQSREVNRVIQQRIKTLSQREHQILDMVVNGTTSREIADQLGIDVKTVTVHRSRINKKLEARNAADLVRLVTLARVESEVSGGIWR